MPPVSLFGRQWRIATDDFVYPSIVEFLFRLGWIVLIAFIFAFHLEEAGKLQCQGFEYQKTTIYLITSLSLLSLTCFNLLALAFQSARGRIFDTDRPRARRWVPLLLYINIVVTIVELVWTIAGTIFVVRDYMKCINETEERHIIIGVLIVIACTYVLLFVKFCVFLFSFRPFGQHQYDLDGHKHHATEGESDLYYKAMRCLMPCTNDNLSIQAFKDVGVILSKVFHDRDLVMSDIAAGLVLLNHHQKKREEEKLHSIRAKSLSAVVANAPELPPDWDNVVYFYKFAAACYGYFWYVMEKPCSHLLSMRPYLNCFKCKCCVRQIGYGVVEDGHCHCNLSAMRAILQIGREDIIYFTNRNKLQEVPFCMVVDRHKQSVVIALRGSLSLQDALTDLRATPTQIVDESLEGLDREWHGHSGMISAARNVYKTLHGVGDDGVTAVGYDLMAHAFAEPEYQGYNITVTGHSLGAGAATILSFMLRARYPDANVRCYAYSPPGGLLSEPAAVESEKFVTSVIVGLDLVPRLSLPNLAQLSQRIRAACEVCQTPKYKLLGKGVLAVCCKKSQSKTLDEEIRNLPAPPLSPSSSSPSLSSEEPLLGSPSVGAGASSRNSTSVTLFRKMVLPGKIFHINKESEERFEVSEKSRDEFSEILVSPQMLSDHFPLYVGQALRNTVAVSEEDPKNHHSETMSTVEIAPQV